MMSNHAPGLAPHNHTPAKDSDRGNLIEVLIPRFSAVTVALAVKTDRADMGEEEKEGARGRGELEKGDIKSRNDGTYTVRAGASTR